MHWIVSTALSKSLLWQQMMFTLVIIAKHPLPFAAVFLRNLYITKVAPVVAEELYSTILTTQSSITEFKCTLCTIVLSSLLSSQCKNVLPLSDKFLYKSEDV